MLSHLHDAGLRIEICTSSPRRYVVNAMEMLGISDRVERIISGADQPRGKPDPLPYVETLRQLGVLPASACAFEDSAGGVETAVAAGLNVLAVGSSCSDLREFHWAHRAENYLHLNDRLSGYPLRRSDVPPNRSNRPLGSNLGSVVTRDK